MIAGQMTTIAATTIAIIIHFLDAIYANAVEYASLSLVVVVDQMNPKWNATPRMRSKKYRKIKIRIKIIYNFMFFSIHTQTGQNRQSAMLAMQCMGKKLWSTNSKGQ